MGLCLLHAVGAERRLLVFTDREMAAHFEADRAQRRFSPANQIELMVVPLPPDLAEALATARQAASAEVSPRRE